MTRFTRRDFLKTTLGAGAAMLALPGLSPAAQGQPSAYAVAHSAARGAARPNIVLIMADDMGFSDIGCYGGEIPTPNIDALAEGGIRFTQFYNTSRCCPTRASLLTGLYSHQAGIGDMTGDAGPEFPAYRGALNDRCVTIAEALRPAGYFTIQTGKWHVGSKKEEWPLQRGFDRCYSTPEGGGFYFKPKAGRTIIEGNEVLYNHTDKLPPEGWYTTDAWTDSGIRFIDEALGQKKPFFLYLAHNAPHWPLQAPAEEIARFKGKYMIGWDKLREERHARQVELGVMDKKWPPAPRDEKVRSWEALSEQEKEAQDLRMATYAAVVAHMDRSVGRLVAHLKEKGVFDNTLIFFLSDNGGCHEGGLEGSDGLGTPGTAESHVCYGQSWAMASNTPFRMYKHWTHEGGIATPLIAHWPAAIKRGGYFNNYISHVIDLMATCVDVAGAEYPKTFNGKPVTPLEGRSLAPILHNRMPQLHQALYWEHEGNRAVRAGQYKLVAKAGGPWELYDLYADRTELHDLAADRPEVVKALSGKWEAWAKKVGALPKPAAKMAGQGKKKNGKGKKKKNQPA